MIKLHEDCPVTWANRLEQGIIPAWKKFKAGDFAFYVETILQQSGILSATEEKRIAALNLLMAKLPGGFGKFAAGNGFGFLKLRSCAPSTWKPQLTA